MEQDLKTGAKESWKRWPPQMGKECEVTVFHVHVHKMHLMHFGFLHNIASETCTSTAIH